jgi:hypothetical protein
MLANPQPLYWPPRYASSFVDALSRAHTRTHRTDVCPIHGYFSCRSPERAQLLALNQTTRFDHVFVATDGLAPPQDLVRRVKHAVSLTGVLHVTPVGRVVRHFTRLSH